MSVQRFQNPSIIKKLTPFFTGDGSFTKDIIAKDLLTLMVAVPERIFVVVNFDDNDLQFVNPLGFLIAWVEDERDHAWLSQAWSKPGQNRRAGREALDMVKQWASDKFGLHEIRYETERSPKAITRAWGFETHAYVMKCKF